MVNRPPPDWGEESLTQFLDDVRRNHFATFHQQRVIVQDVSKIDQALAGVLQNQTADEGELPGLLMFQRSHGAYRAAASVTFATQCAEAPCVLRLALECAGYAALLVDDQRLAELWLRREESPESKRAVRDAFTPTKTQNAIAQRDRDHAALFRRLYDELIDFGAHPNPNMVLGSLTMTRTEQNTRVSSAYLPGGGPLLDMMLRRLVQVGIWLLRLFALLFPARAKAGSVQDVLTTISPIY